jgi:hypothetical protein
MTHRGRSSRNRDRLYSHSHMVDERRNDNRGLVDELVAVVLGLPLLEVLGDVWKMARKALLSRAYGGLCEVPEYESTLGLKDRGGKGATFKTRPGGMERSSSTTAAPPARRRVLLDGLGGRDPVAAQFHPPGVPPADQEAKMACG